MAALWTMEIHCSIGHVAIEFPLFSIPIGASRGKGEQLMWKIKGDRYLKVISLEITKKNPFLLLLDCSRTDTNVFVHYFYILVTI